jgi:hypothetical protein
MPQLWRIVRCLFLWLTQWLSAVVAATGCLYGCPHYKRVMCMGGAGLAHDERVMFADNHNEAAMQRNPITVSEAQCCMGSLRAGLS